MAPIHVGTAKAQSEPHVWEFNVSIYQLLIIITFFLHTFLFTIEGRSGHTCILHCVVTFAKFVFVLTAGTEKTTLTLGKRSNPMSAKK